MGLESLTPWGAAAGVVANGVGLFQAFKGAKHMEDLKSGVPAYARSKYAGDMLTTAQNELNNNPFLALQNRRFDTTMANQVASAGRAATDPSQLLAMVSAYGAASNDMAQQQELQNYAMRNQKIQGLNNAYQVNMQEDQNVYNNNMTRFNSIASLQQAADQTKTSAFQNLGGSLLGAANLFGGGFSGNDKKQAPTWGYR